MVMLATDNLIPTYRLVDDAGFSVGRIVLPVADRISGRGAETIYLQRDPPFRRRAHSYLPQQQGPLIQH